MAIVSISHDRNWLHVGFSDGTSESYFGAWLRDNIASGRHQGAGQRTFDINRLDAITIANASLDADTVTVSFEPEGLIETFDERYLRGTNAGPLAGTQVLWGREIQAELEFADFEALRTHPHQLRDWLVQIRDFGFGLVENVPITPGSILDVVDLFGYVRKTNYGEIFDVRVEDQPANLAFTSLEIGMHTDNPYRDPVPGLQLLHCLVNETDGGENQLCDGFAVAEAIRTKHPEAFELLSTCQVRFSFAEAESTHLESLVPLIELDPSGEIVSVRYNSRSIQAFEMSPDVIAEYYHAYRVLGQALHDSAGLIEFRLGAGQLMVLDNERVLHGRSSYSRGERHLQGCYADKDSLRSRIRLIEAA